MNPTNAELSCRECRDALVDLAAGTLSAADRQAVERHLASCADCRLERDLWLALGDTIRERGRHVPDDGGFATGLVRLRTALADDDVAPSHREESLMEGDPEHDPGLSDRQVSPSPRDAGRVGTPGASGGATRGATHGRPYPALAATAAIILLGALVFGSFAARLRAGPGVTGSATPTATSAVTPTMTATPVPTPPTPLPTLAVPAGTVTEFHITEHCFGCGLHGITSGPDGALWFTEQAAGYVGRITTIGIITQFPIPYFSGNPEGITSGPDGTLWFVGQPDRQPGSVNYVGRITTSGDITTFPIPTANSGPAGITTGPDGALWFAEHAADKIGRITPSGRVTEFAVPTANSWPTDITTGPDGALWFTEFSKSQIGRITMGGDITEFPINGGPIVGIARGPDDNLWFTEPNGYVGRITTRGTIKLFHIPADCNTQGITSGPDGALWFTEAGRNKIGRMTTGGSFTEFAVPTANSWPNGITGGPDGALWFTELGSDKLGRLAL